MSKKSNELFDKQKQQCLSATDLSRKGSIDAPIEELVHFINLKDDFFTTSSCSGRIILFEEELQDESCYTKKKGCHWLYTTHQDCCAENLVEALSKSKWSASFKFEPFVMHVQCRNIEAARIMLVEAVGSGFRNSGMMIGKKGKYIVAVRSTHSLEVPLTDQGRLLVSSEYVDYLARLANTKLQENLMRIQRFFSNLKKALESRRPESADMTDDRETDNTPKLRKKTLDTDSDVSHHRARTLVSDTENVYEQLGIDGACLEEPEVIDPSEEGLTFLYHQEDT